MSFAERPLALLLLVAACAGGGASWSAAEEAEPVRIGLLEATGPEAGAMARGAEEAVQEINAGGGIDGRAVVLLRLPASRPWHDGAMRTAQLVFGNDLVALVGPVETKAAHVAAQIATKRRIPIITLADEAALTRVGDPWIFNGIPKGATGDPPPLEALAYDMVWAVAAAARRRGATPAAVRDGLHDDAVVSGRSGQFAFDENGRRTARGRS